MGPTMKDLGIDKLAPEQRAALLREITESLGDAGSVGDLTPDQWAEIERRDAEMDANPGIAVSWDQIRSRVEAGQ